MKFLTLDYIKAHCRIDLDCEDSLLELYGDSAETTVLNRINKTFEEVIEEYGNMPTPLIQGALMLVDTSYTYRTMISPTNMSLVPYTFELLVKPYAKL